MVRALEPAATQHPTFNRDRTRHRSLISASPLFCDTQYVAFDQRPFRQSQQVKIYTLKQKTELESDTARSLGLEERQDAREVAACGFAPLTFGPSPARSPPIHPPPFLFVFLFCIAPRILSRYLGLGPGVAFGPSSGRSPPRRNRPRWRDLGQKTVKVTFQSNLYPPTLNCLRSQSDHPPLAEEGALQFNIK